MINNNISLLDVYSSINYIDIMILDNTTELLHLCWNEKYVLIKNHPWLAESLRSNPAVWVDFWQSGIFMSILGLKRGPLS